MSQNTVPSSLQLTHRFVVLEKMATQVFAMSYLLLFSRFYPLSLSLSSLPPPPLSLSLSLQVSLLNIFRLLFMVNIVNNLVDWMVPTSLQPWPSIILKDIGECIRDAMFRRLLGGDVIGKVLSRDPGSIIYLVT